MAKTASDFDIVHCHTDWLHLPLLTQMGVPHLTTIHNRLDTPDLPPVISRFPDAPLISISDHHRAPLPSANWLGTVYHGLPVDSLHPCYAPGQYLAFLGRLTQEKGPEAAIRLARATGQPLRMAAKIPRRETRYYKERLQPLIDGQQVKLVGEVNDAAKSDLLRGASASTVDLAALLLIQPLHGVTFALLHLACMRLLGEHIPPQLAATAQAIYGTLGIGAVTAALTIASGWLYGSLGSTAFVVMAGICVAALPVALSIRSATSHLALSAAPPQT